MEHQAGPQASLGTLHDAARACVIATCPASSHSSVLTGSSCNCCLVKGDTRELSATHVISPASTRPTRLLSLDAIGLHVSNGPDTLEKEVTKKSVSHDNKMRRITPTRNLSNPAAQATFPYHGLRASGTQASVLDTGATTRRVQERSSGGICSEMSSMRTLHLKKSSPPLDECLPPLVKPELKVSLSHVIHGLRALRGAGFEATLACFDQ